MGNFRALFILILLSGLYPSNSIAKPKDRPREELIVVQTVSSDQHSFVVSKGAKDGIFKGQEIIFANENVSIVCKALEVNRNFSLWIPINGSINIPFKKEEIVSFNSHAYGNVALDVVGDYSNLTPVVDSEIEFKKFRVSNNFSLKASYDQGLSQSSSDVSADKSTKRSGNSFALDYNYRYMPEFEISAGARIDNEVYRITAPELDISTRRIMATISATYHLIDLSNDKNNFYLGLSAGIGRSTTTVSDDTSSGTVTLLPEAKIGYLMPFSKSMAMIFEGSVESISSTEKFKSNETEQVTNMLNAKLTLGLRF